MAAEPIIPLTDIRPAEISSGNRSPALSIIRKRSDFLAANRGARAVKPGFILLVRRDVHADGAMRIGYTVTKKIGNAVVRNRLKRRLRALARQILPENGVPKADHILIGRGDGLDRPFAAMSQDLMRALHTLKTSDGSQSHWKPRKNKGKSVGKPQAKATGRDMRSSDSRGGGKGDGGKTP